MDGLRDCIEGVRYGSRRSLNEHAHSVVTSEVVAQSLVVLIEVNLSQTVALAVESKYTTHNTARVYRTRNPHAIASIKLRDAALQPQSIRRS